MKQQTERDLLECTYELVGHCDPRLIVDVFKSVLEADMAMKARDTEKGLYLWARAAQVVDELIAASASQMGSEGRAKMANAVSQAIEEES